MKWTQEPTWRSDDRRFRIYGEKSGYFTLYDDRQTMMYAGTFHTLALAMEAAEKIVATAYDPIALGS